MRKIALTIALATLSLAASAQEGARRSTSLAHAATYTVVAGGLAGPRDSDRPAISKVYGVTSKTRVASLPGVPTPDEAGLTGFEVVIWNALCAPKGTPKPAH
jgi:ABC-type amino acid transport substrate-binding protein